MDNAELNVWQAKISRCSAYQQTQHPNWSEAIDLINCNLLTKKFGIDDSEYVEVNFAKWFIDAIVPMIYYKDPYIFIKPKHERYTSFAQTAETVVNYYWRELALKQQMQRCIASALLTPPGWMQIGYTAKIGQDIAKLDEEQNKSVIQNIKDFIKGKLGEPKEKTPAQQGVLNEYIEEESPFVNWENSWKILVPPGYQAFNQMPYIIVVETVAKIDFLANPLYKNKNQVSLASGRNATSSKFQNIETANYDNSTDINKDDDSETIDLYHIWDKRTQKRYTITIGCNDAHFEGDWPYDFDGFTVEPLIFEDNLPSKTESNFYPVNALTPILPQIREQSSARTQMSKWRKRASGYILAQKGLANDEDIKQIEETEALQIIYVNNISAFQFSQSPQLPPDVFNVDNVIKQDLQMGTSMGQVMFMPMPGQRTATQAGIAQSGLQIKVQAKIDRVEDFTVKIATKLFQVCWQLLDRQKISEIIGEPVTEEMWPTPPEDKKERKRIIKSQLQLRIDAGSAAAPKDETVETKQAIDIITVLGTLMPERLNKPEIAKALFRRNKFSKDLDKLIIGNDEAEIMAAEEENKLLGMNIPQVVSPNENHQLHVAVHGKMTQPTDAGDLHLSQHGKFMGIAGMTSKPKTSTNPEIKRQGLPNESDTLQSVQNMGVGTGPETMA
ncbi:MAG: hypothetical protein PHQ22_10390 [Sulfuricurvum sp.]|nr:hypothetical protein [Sulfuricurvum sp.]